MTTAVLSYTVNTGLRSNNAAELARVGALPITDSNVLSFLGCSVSVDTTAAVGDDIVRVINLLFNATGEALWPTDAEKTYAVQNLYTSQLEMLSPGYVFQTTDPVIIP